MLLVAGVLLGVLGGYAVAVARQSHKEYRAARKGVRILGPKRLTDTWYAALAVIVIVLALAIYGSGQLG